MGIIIKSAEEIAVMRQAGRIVATVLEMISRRVKPGMETEELDIIAAEEVERLGAKPSFKGYRGFPANLCVSVNDEIVHGSRESVYFVRVILYLLTLVRFIMVFRAMLR